MWKLIGGLLALPVLLVLSVLMIFLGSEDYTRISPTVEKILADHDW